MKEREAMKAAAVEFISLMGLIASEDLLISNQMKRSTLERLLVPFSISAAPSLSSAQLLFLHPHT